ncbi:hypothetical protein OESDEN_14379 [Oesophagostomum dentatum]|uniref:HEAT repeat protein n=1 Tax=Oesophagostomum dentatum TaxID=61180 RepID=A0A0B1SLR4_OESDE|nr:hypothetical protein OESDEN_14379 [Oesophagostomum dentatum]
MIYTVHTLLGAMRDVLKSGDMDPCLEDILDIVVQEQFTAVSEEKEVGEIKAEVSEAKKNPTPGTLLLLGRYVSSSAVGVLLNRFMTVVDSLTSAKMISKARNLLSMFGNGLKDNQGFAPASQLIFIHQMLVTNTEKMKTVTGNQKEPTDSEFLEEEHKSCLLLPPEPKRIGVLVKPVLKSRSHIFLEFALQLLGALITGKHFDRNDPEHIKRLDPFVPLIIRSLEFKYEKEGARSIAVDLLAQISKIEKDAFAPHFRMVLPALRAIFASESLFSNNSERTISGICYGIATMLQSMGEEAREVFALEDFCALFDSLEPLMKCEGSSAIRLSAASLIGQCLSHYDLAFFTPERASELMGWCCWQLRDKQLAENVALQASKILMVISHHLTHEQFTTLVEKLAHICHFEISHQPNLSLKVCFRSPQISN